MKIRAKYGGKCHGCHCYVNRGNLCHYEPDGARGRKIRCLDCGDSNSGALISSLFPASQVPISPERPNVIIEPIPVSLSSRPPIRNKPKVNAGAIADWVITAAVVLLIAVASFGGGGSSKSKSSSVSSQSTAERSKALVAENGSYFGQPNKNHVPKTVHVNGYYRSDGSYVRGHYRSAPYSNPPHVSSRTDTSNFNRPPPSPSYSAPKPYIAENGSYYGQSNSQGVPKTTHVRGYYRKDGTYVRGHYRSK